MHHHHDVGIPGRKQPIDRCPLRLPRAWGCRILGETVYHKRCVECARPWGAVGSVQCNFKRYRYQGIGRYEPEAVYARGVTDLKVLEDLVPSSGFLFGARPNSIDAGICGFTANIYFYEIDTPLKHFLVTRPNLVTHCPAVHAAIDG